MNLINNAELFKYYVVSLQFPAKNMMIVLVLSDILCDKKLIQNGLEIFHLLQKLLGTMKQKAA
jgi:hypothetical protein